MNIESVWYECSPYIYAVSGGAAMWAFRSGLGLLSGTMLAATALTIIYMRWSHRRA